MKRILTAILILTTSSAFCQTTVNERDSVTNTVAFQKKVKLKALSAANDLLADPTLYDRREHIIYNYGTGLITFNYPLWYDKVTSVSNLNFSFPDNVIKIFSNGVKWMASK